MKGITVSALYIGLTLAMSCKGKNPVTPFNCAANAEKVSKAALAWGENQTPANCEAYKKEIAAFVKSCPAFYTGTTKEELEEFVNTPCE